MLACRFRGLLAVLGIALVTSCGTGPAVSKPAAKKKAPAAAVPAPTASAIPQAEAQPKTPPKPESRTTFSSPEDALATLRQALADDDADQVRKAQAWLVGRGAAALPTLQQALADDGAAIEYRLIVCKLLGGLGPTGTPLLLQTVEHSDERLKLRAIETLGVVRPFDKQIISALVALLDNPDPQIRRTTIRSLATIGPPAKEAMPRLLSILNGLADGDTVRSEAKAAIVKIEPRHKFDVD